MADVEFHDGGIGVMKLREFDGRYGLRFTSNRRWNFPKTMDIRDSDVFICTYPKSGTHLVWDVVTMLMKGDGKPVNELMEKFSLDFGSPKRYDTFPSPRVLTTHLYPAELPADIREKGCKIIYVLRDPKDACVSYYNHLTRLKGVYGGKFPDFIKLFIEGKVPFNKWSEHVLHWGRFEQCHPQQPLLVVHYEDILQSPMKGIRRIAEFLDISVGESLLEDIIDNTSFAKMKQIKESLHSPYLFTFADGKEIMYRKGVVGDWVNWFQRDKKQEFNERLSKEVRNEILRNLSSARRYFHLSRM